MGGSKGEINISYSKQKSSLHNQAIKGQMQRNLDNFSFVEKPL